MQHLELYVPIIKFLASYLGKDYEIILSNTKKVLYIANAFDSSQSAGVPIDEYLQSLVEDPALQKRSYVMNFRTFGPSMEKFRSATLFIRDNDRLVGLLTINTKLTQLIQMREVLDSLINGNQKPADTNTSDTSSDYYETVGVGHSVAETIDMILSEACVRFESTLERFTLDEKMSIMREMESRGVFLVKGSVSEVSKKLNSSDATIYRYLHQIRNNTK